MITAERNQLAEDIIQACECLKSWWTMVSLNKEDDDEDLSGLLVMARSVFR
jgi:hypothetical protein